MYLIEKRNKKLKTIKALLLTVFLVFVLVPIILVVLTSFKLPVDIFTIVPRVVFTPTLDNYRGIWERGTMVTYLGNSIIVALGTTTLTVFLATGTAYWLSRNSNRNTKRLSFIILIGRMVPSIVLVVPIFTIMMQLGLVKTYTAVILAHSTFNLPFAIWMLRSFVDDIPVELDEAAMVDGCSVLMVFWKIIVPVTLPGIVATGILTTLFSWNEFLFATVLTGVGTRTMPIGISSFIGSVSIDWGGSSAAAVLAMIPIIIGGALVQKHLIRGLTMGAVKG